MLDVVSGKTVDYPAIFVGSDGRITNIADARTVRWGADVRHIDLGERTLLPGLIDMHVHLTSLAEVGGSDRKSVGSGKSVSLRVDLGGRRIITKKKKTLTS